MSARRGPEAYVHGEGRNVVVPWRVAALLMSRAGLEDYHREHRGLDPELDDVLLALKLVATHWRTSVAGSEDRKSPEVAPLCPWVTSTQAADLLGVGDRGIRLAIAEKRLPAEMVGGRWQIAREDVEHFRAAKRAA